MPRNKIADFSVERVEILSSEGTLDQKLAPDIPKEKLLEIYRLMTTLRVFDEKAFKLQRQGRLGTYAQVLGQEATQIVPPLCLNKKDWLIPTYRGHGAYFSRGMPMVNALLYWGGDDRGVKFPEGSNDLIFAIPVGTHLTQAAGVAWGAKLSNDPSVVLCYLGDGATSKGDFHEALTFAGVFKLPVIYFIENNQWAISVPRSRQSASVTLAQKAFGYGVHGLQVDGNDVFAIYWAMAEAIKRARSGEGASVIEAETYRLGDHTTADDASRYRSVEEVQAWKKKDPIARLRSYLVGRKLWAEAEEAALLTDCETKVKSTIEEFEAYPQADPLDIFKNVFAQAPWNVKEQEESLRQILNDKKARSSDGDFVHQEGSFP